MLQKFIDRGFTHDLEEVENEEGNLELFDLDGIEELFKNGEG